MIGVFVKVIIWGILVRVIVSVIRHVKLTNIFEMKNCSWEKRLFGKFVLACEDEILNKTETSLDEKKLRVK